MTVTDATPLSSSAPGRQNPAARGVGVVLSAEHSCMSLRGAGIGGIQTVTGTWFGALREQPRERDAFPAFAGLR